MDITDDSRAVNVRSIKIGIVAVLAYVSNYCLRGVLTVLTAYMLNDGFDKEYLAALSAVYMLAYAIGQLVNGFLGDMVRPKKMVLTGLVLAGLTQMLFPFFPKGFGHTACFFLLGFGLSMLRGPLMRIVTGSTPLNHARLICVFFSAASFIGPLAVSLVAAFFRWNSVFIICGAIAAGMGVLSFLALTAMERKGMIFFTSAATTGPREMLGLFKLEHFGYYIFMACIIEAVISSISFWIPTLLNEYVSFTEVQSNLIFSGISTLRAVMPFVTLLLFRLTGEREAFLVRIFCGLCAAFLLALLMLPAGWGSVAALVLGMISFSAVSATLWSVYIPSLGKTGHVSAANGLLDASGYFAASLFNIIFAQIVTDMGWKALIASWIFLPVSLLIVNFICFGKESKK